MKRRSWTVLAAAAVLLAAVPYPVRTGVDRLDADIRHLIDRFPNGAHWGILVVSLDQGDTLFANAPDSMMAPASNMKLLTTSAAMHALGPDYRYRTWLLSDGVVEDGVLKGDLVVYGTGDPGLSSRFYPDRTAALDSLAVQLEARGITAVEGDLVADVSFLPGPPRPPGWDPDDLNDHFAAPVSALNFNENVASLWVEAASTAGARPTVNFLPEDADLPLANFATTVSGRASPRLRIVREDPDDPIRVEGEISTGGRDIWRQMTVSDPPRFTLSVFRSVLGQHGIGVLGDARVVHDASESLLGGSRVTGAWASDTPRPHVLARLTSPPLIDYLTVINKKSHNLLAELTFRTLGRALEGDPSAEASARAVRTVLSGMGIDLGSVVQLDGSGLSAGNRVSPAQFISVLQGMSRDPRWENFWETLPEAGTRGGLTRMYQTAAAGNLRAKTGTIENVSALTGVVKSADGERLAFSIVVNATPSTGRAKGIENAIGARLAEFTRNEAGG